MPILRVNVVDKNSDTIALTGDNTCLIKYHSDAQATMKLQFGNMNLDACVIINGSERAYATSHVFNNVESNVFTFSCADADGQNYRKEETTSWIEYIRPTCNMNQSNISGDGKIALSCYGRFFNGSFGKVTNDLTVRCRCKAIGATSFTSWWDMNVTKDENVYYANLTIQNLNYEKNYICEIEATDELETITAQRTVSSKPIFHWGKDDFAFEVPKVRIGSNSVLPNGEDYGNFLMLGDGENCYIAEYNSVGGDNDDFMTIYARAGINFETHGGNKVYVNGDAISGTWEPALLDEAIISYTACYGWYTKLGDIVTVGFYIKALGDGGYEDEHIEITGLPFIPSESAAGGGMCSGAYVTSGYNFQCFVAEIDSTITTRVQICNHTADSALSTSGSGCNYRKTSGTITLSGTITYTTAELS